jgi:hypothetical protein
MRGGCLGRVIVDELRDRRGFQGRVLVREDRGGLMGRVERFRHLRGHIVQSVWEGGRDCRSKGRERRWRQRLD